jgi:5-methylcytosine-specific restriction endonuclease McrA
MSKKLMSKLQIGLDDGSLLEIVDNSLSNLAVLRALGFAEKGQYNVIVRKFLQYNEVDTHHFTINGVPKAKTKTLSCINCGNIFETADIPSNKQVTCSRACSNTYFRSGENNGNFTTGAGSYRGKALSYLLKVCNRCGFSDERALEVHHKDRDRENNDIANLEVLCSNCHTIEHKSNK